MLVQLRRNLFHTSGSAYGQGRFQGFLLKHLIKAAPDLVIGLLGLPIAFALQKFPKAIGIVGSTSDLTLISMQVACFLSYALFIFTCYVVFSVLFLEMLDTVETGGKLPRLRSFAFILLTICSLVLLSVSEDFEQIKQLTGILIVAPAVEGLPRIFRCQKRREGHELFASIMASIYCLWFAVAFVY
jgi:hypothetical protein